MPMSFKDPRMSGPRKSNKVASEYSVFRPTPKHSCCMKYCGQGVYLCFAFAWWSLDPQRRATMKTSIVDHCSFRTFCSHRWQLLRSSIGGLSKGGSTMILRWDRVSVAFPGLCAESFSWWGIVTDAVNREEIEIEMLLFSWHSTFGHQLLDYVPVGSFCEFD